MKKFLALSLLAILLPACAPKEEATSLAVENSSKLETLSSEEFGVEFTYPAGWLSYEQDGEGSLDLRVTNMEMEEGFSCPGSFLGFYVVSRPMEEGSGDFDTWMKANFDEQGSLGQFSGFMNATTVKDLPAYEVGGFGWETACPHTGYVVDYGNDQVLQIVLEGNETAPDYVELESILESLKLTPQ